MWTVDKNLKKMSHFFPQDLNFEFFVENSKSMICGRYLNFWRLNMMRQFLGIFTYCDFDCTPLLYTTKNYSNEETNKLIANEESCWQQKILNLVTKIWLNEMRGNERIKEDHDCLFISFCFVTKLFSRKKSPISKSWSAKMSFLRFFR